MESVLPPDFYGKEHEVVYSLVPKERHVRKESNGITLGLCVVPKESHDCTLVKYLTPKESHDCSFSLT